MDHVDLVVPRQRALKHVQVREHVRSLIEAQPPGSAAPSERELVARFGVARMTVRQALDALVAEGLLERIPGRGTFVAQPPKTAGRLTSFTEEIRRRGMLPESQTLLARVEQAGPGVARALDISPGDPVLHWRRLRRADQAIVCVEDAYLNEVLLPGFLQAAMPTSLFDALAARGLRPTWAEDAITADKANAEEANLLQVQPGNPILVVARRALAGEKPVEVSRSVYRNDRFTLWVQLGQET
jgi:GntR family transcriptional regulator